MKWFLFMVLCVLSTLEFCSARNVNERKDIEKTFNLSEEKLKSSEEYISPLEVMETVPDNTNSHIEKLNIKNLTGFDGKVESIHINDVRDDPTILDDNKPGIHAYGIPKKNFENNGLINRVQLTDPQPEDDARSGRLIQAYGMEKKELSNNGEIEREAIPPSLYKLEDPRNKLSRIPRSLDSAQSENNPKENPQTEQNDLKTEESKVFRPLFVYRQQVAKRQRQHRGNYEG